jgi:hypothetical protein
MTGISDIVSQGYGVWGSIPGIVTLGYQAGLSQTLPIGWSGRPGANQRNRKHRIIQLPPGIAAANDLARSNKEWDELVAQHKKRMAVEASRKVLASAKRAERAAQLPRTTEPRAKAPKVAAPKVARDVSKLVPAAPPPAAAATSSRQQKAPKLMAAAKPAMPTFDHAALSALGIDPQIARGLAMVADFVGAALQHHQAQQQQAVERSRREAERSAQEARRQQQVVRDREAWQRRISTCAERSCSGPAPRAGDRRSSSSIRLRH